MTAAELEGRPVSFLHPQRGWACGTVATAVACAPSRGTIPDFRLTIKGQSGAVVEVSMLDAFAMAHATITEASLAAKSRAAQVPASASVIVRRDVMANGDVIVRFADGSTFVGGVHR